MQKLSSSSLKEGLLGYKYFEALKEFTERAKALKPEAIILFGSLAKGDFHEFSDADVCLILPKDKVDFSEGQDLVMKHNTEGIVEVLVYGKEQFLKVLREANPLALEVAWDGIFLDGNEGYLKAIEEAFALASQEFKLEKLADGWAVKEREK